MILKTFLSDKNFDVINVHSTEAAILLRIAYLFSKKKPRIVYTVHGWGWRGYGMISSSLIKISEYLLFKMTKNEYILLYKKMINESNFLKLKKENYEVITTGLNQELIPRKIEDCVTFVFPARIDKSKDHLQAISLLSKIKNRKIKLIYAGNGTDSPSIYRKYK